MAKRGDVSYTTNLQTMKIIKIKSKDSVDAVILGYSEEPRSYLLGIWDEDDFLFSPFVWVTPQKDFLMGEDLIGLVDQSLSQISVGGRKTVIQLEPIIVVEVEGDKIMRTKAFSCGEKQTGTGSDLCCTNHYSNPLRQQDFKRCYNCLRIP